MKRYRVGDVFRVQLSDGIGFFQYVCDDASQLYSHVIRAFKRRFDSPDLPDAVSTLEVDFYAHVFLAIGVKHNCWTRVGKAPVPDRLEILFRDTNDYGRLPSMPVTNMWRLWAPNAPSVSTPSTNRALRNAHIGLVFNPYSIVARMDVGSFPMPYPELPD
jgi:hypothetical protein